MNGQNSAPTPTGAAAGIGETDGEDHETSERDADGRRLWEDTSQDGEPSPDDFDDDIPF